MKFEYQDKIDKYVRGEMSSDERKKFEQELLENEELRDQMTYTEKVSKLVSSREQKMAMLHSWEQEYSQEKQKMALSTRTLRKQGIWISGIAAILIVGFFVVSPMFMYKGTDYGNGNVRGDDDVFESAPASVDDTTIVDTIAPIQK